MNKILQSIPFKRLVIYLLVLGALPIFYVPFDFFTKKERLRKSELYLQRVMQTAQAKEKKQETNTVVRALYSKADPHFLDQKIGTLPLLVQEKKALEKLMKECAYPGGASNEARYRFLAGEENRLHFQPGATQTKEKIEETLMTLAHPVEIDAADMKKILQMIEEKQVGQPELLITDFKLNKKLTPNKREVYELQMQLIKREFLP